MSFFFQLHISPSPLVQKSPASSFYRKWKLASGKLIDLSKVIELKQLLGQSHISHLSGQVLLVTEWGPETNSKKEVREDTVSPSRAFMPSGHMWCAHFANCIMTRNVWDGALEEFSVREINSQTLKALLRWPETFHQTLKGGSHFQKWGWSEIQFPLLPFPARLLSWLCRCGCPFFSPATHFIIEHSLGSSPIILDLSSSL